MSSFHRRIQPPGPLTKIPLRRKTTRQELRMFLLSIVLLTAPCYLLAGLLRLAYWVANGR